MMEPVEKSMPAMLLQDSMPEVVPGNDVKAAVELGDAMPAAKRLETSRLTWEQWMPSLQWNWWKTDLPWVLIWK
jgi:hypothetical protein